jgi:fibronectin type 3 domain-containing protein
MKKHPAGVYVANLPHQYSQGARRSCFGLLAALVVLAASFTFSSCASQGLAGVPGSSASNAVNGGSSTSNLPSAPIPFSTPGGAHDVSLTWNPSGSSGVVGYNIYRGTGSGGPYTKLNATTLPLTRFTDTTVQAGQTYYYVVTATASTNVESVYSNEVVAPVP